MGSSLEEKMRCFGESSREKAIILWEKYWSASGNRSSAATIGIGGYPIKGWKQATNADPKPP
jgi:hypothetical protein